MNRGHLVPRYWKRTYGVPPPQSLQMRPEVHTLEDLAEVPCLILLGESGLGKTTAVDTATRALGSPLPRALDSASDAREIKEWIADALERARNAPPAYLFLDGLDEAVVDPARAGRLIADALKGDPDAPLRLRIVCRGAALPASLQADLVRIYGSEKVACYTLQPLRPEDIASIARQEMGDRASPMLDRWMKPPLDALASRPLTLRLLMESSGSGAESATTAYEVYDDAMNVMVRDADERRQRTSIVSPPERRRIARAVATASLLAHRPRIVADRPLGSLADAITPDDLRGIASTDELRELILSAPLFTVEDAHSAGVKFAHRSYAEFLAAEQLARHPSPDEVVKHLSLRNTTASRVIPSLRGVAAWLGQRARFFELILAHDPVTLLEMDPGFVTERDRERLIDAGLARAEDFNALPWDYPADRIARFSHARLAEQLRKWITDSTASDEARSTAAEVAQREAVRDHTKTIAVDLARFATEERGASNTLRVDAARAVVASGDRSAIQRLLPLLEEKDDDRDQLKGIALAALWPWSIDRGSVWEHLVQPRDDHFFGAYYAFASGVLPAGLRHEDVPAALRWCAQNLNPRSSWPPAEIGERALALALERMDGVEVQEAIVDYVRAAFDVYARPAADLVKALDTCEEGVRNERRFALLELLVRRLDGEREHHHVLATELRPLVERDDLPALLDRAEAAVILREKLAWLCLALDQHSAGEWRDARATGRIAELHRTTEDETVRSLLAPWVNRPPENDRTRAERARRREMLRRERRLKADAVEFPQTFRSCLARTLAGDLDALWETVYWMGTQTRNDGLRVPRSSVHLLDTDAWKSLDDVLQSGLLRAAADYLKRGVAGSTIDPRGAAVGRQILVLLHERSPASLDVLLPETWETWLPALIDLPWMPEEAPRDVVTALLRRAYGACGATYRSRTLDALRAEWSVYPTVMDVIDPVIDDSFVAALVRVVEAESPGPDALGCLLRSIARHDATAARRLAVEVVTREWDLPDKTGARAVSAAAELLRTAPDFAWGVLRALFDRSPRRGAEVILRAEICARGVWRWCPAFESPEVMGSFYLWGSRALPGIATPSDRPHDAQTPRDVLSETLHGVLERLADLGTEAALATLDALQKALPNDASVSWWQPVAKERSLKDAGGVASLYDVVRIFCEPSRQG